jgi:predicted AAA+ superfamily ATPase
MKLFNRFTLIGGMPEVISTYLSTKDVITLNPVYETLINGYSEDVEKYARNESMVQHIRHILKTGFGSASQRIKFEGFGQSNYRSREMGEAFRTLEKAMLLELMYPLTSMKPPLNPDFKKSPRLQWIDTGLVNYFSGIQHDVFMSKEIIELYKGSIAEHIVGQEILSHDCSFLSKRFFWVREKPTATAEIDFILPYKSLFIPIEVKAGKSGRLRSLHYYMNQSSIDVAVRIGSSPYSIEDIETHEGKKFQLIHLPFYMICVIEKIIEKMI